MVVVALVLELLPNKNILLVNGIAFTKSLGKCWNLLFIIRLLPANIGFLLMIIREQMIVIEIS